MSEIVIRDATSDDAARIAEIYNHYVENTTVTFDTGLKSAEDRAEWLATHGPRHPVLVALLGTDVLGWASLSPYSTRPAWDRTVEVGLYLDHGATGAGIGSALMSSILERAVQAGHHAVIGQIVADNEASLRLSAKFGFREVGRLEEVGHKFGRVLDVVLHEKLLD